MMYFVRLHGKVNKIPTRIRHGTCEPVSRRVRFIDESEQAITDTFPIKIKVVIYHSLKWQICFLSLFRRKIPRPLWWPNFPFYVRQLTVCRSPYPIMLLRIGMMTIIHCHSLSYPIPFLFPSPLIPFLLSPPLSSSPTPPPRVHINFIGIVKFYLRDHPTLFLYHPSISSFIEVSSLINNIYYLSPYNIFNV